MDEQRLRKLGVIKSTELSKSFDEYYDTYKSKAEESGYTGEVKGIIFNTNNHPVTIHKGMKFGQAVLCPVVNGGWVHLDKREEVIDKERGSNGFGSTGI